jgi:hypothetical protein
LVTRSNVALTQPSFAGAALSFTKSPDDFVVTAFVSVKFGLGQPRLRPIIM